MLWWIWRVLGSITRRAQCCYAWFLQICFKYLKQVSFNLCRRRQRKSLSRVAREQRKQKRKQTTLCCSRPPCAAVLQWLKLIFNKFTLFCYPQYNLDPLSIYPIPWWFLKHNFPRKQKGRKKRRSEVGGGRTEKKGWDENGQRCCQSIGREARRERGDDTR